MADETAAPAAEDTHLDGLATRIPAVFTAPGNLFASVNRSSTRSDWLIPLLLVMGVVLASTYVTLPVIQSMQIEAAQARMAEDPDMTPEKLEKAAEMMQKVGGVAALVATPITVFVMALLQALILMGVANLLLGGSATFGRTLSVIAYASLIMIPATIVTTPLVLLKETPFAQVGLNLLLTETTGFLHAFLAMVNVFAIWQYAVVGIGLGAVAGIETRKATIAVFVLYLLYAAGASALAS